MYSGSGSIAWEFDGFEESAGFLADYLRTELQQFIGGRGIGHGRARYSREAVGCLW